METRGAGLGLKDRQCNIVVKSTGFSISPSLLTPQLCDLGHISGPQFSHLLNGKCKIFLSGCQRLH